MIDRLRLRVRPIAGEPAHSIAARLAARHRIPIGSFLQPLGLDIRALAAGKRDARLAALSSIDASAIAQETAHSTGHGQSVVLCGEPLSWVDWSVSPRRICPACLYEDRIRAEGETVGWSAWHRTWWDVRVIHTCPDHGQALISRCPQCDEALGWTAGAIDHCSRGHLLADDVAPTYSDTSADSYLRGRLLSPQTRVKNAFLDELSLGDAARVMERIGAIALDGWRLQFSSTGEDQERTRRKNAGLLLSEALEPQMDRILDEVLRNAPEGARGLVANYGWIYRSWLGVPSADQSRGSLHSILMRHAARHGLIASAEHEVTATTVNLKTAAAALAKGRTSTRSIASAAGILPPGSRRGVAFHIDASKLAGLGRRIGALVAGQTAAKLLGIGRSQFRSLVEQGLVRPDEEAIRLGCGSLFAPDVLSDFITRLSAGAPVVSGAPSRSMPVPIACRTMGIPMWRVCQLILRQELFPVACHERKVGIAGIMVATTEIGKVRPPRKRPVETVAQALRIHPEAASQLLKLGAFGQPPDVSAESIAAFEKHYAKPADLADAPGASGRSVIRILAKANVIPAFGPPQCRQVFFLRNLAKTLLDAPLPRSFVQ